MGRRRLPKNEPKKLSIRVDPGEKDIREVSVVGVIDGHTFQRLENCFDQLIESNHHRLIVNFEGLEYISSAGVGVLINVLSRIEERDGRLVLFGVGNAVSDVFDLLGLRESFTMTEDRAAAALAAQT